MLYKSPCLTYDKLRWIAQTTFILRSGLCEGVLNVSTMRDNRVFVRGRLKTEGTSSASLRMSKLKYDSN